MPTTSATSHDSVLSTLDIDARLLAAVISGTVEGLAMTGIVPPPVGASRLVSTTRPIAVVVGMVGKSNGSLTLSFDERTMLHIAGALMGEPQTMVNEENLDAIGEIGNIATVIGGISDETNLLSLNAAIIAAQAGEHGKAFAVVADQVKTLARRTTASTKEIERLIADVQARSARTMGAPAAA